MVDDKRPPDAGRVLFLGVLCLLALLILLHARALDRDPPVVDWSVGSWGDPGHYLYNAWSRVKFGDWRAEEGTSLYVTPGFALLAAGAFSLFGTEWSVAVALTWISSFIVFFGTALLAGEMACDGKARRSRLVLALLSMLSSYVLFAYSIVPKGDMESTAVAVLAALAQAGIARAPHHYLRPLAFIAGLGIVAAPFVKIFAGIFSVTTIVAWFLSITLDRSPEWRARWRAAGPALLIGMLAGSFLWIGWLAWLNQLGALDHLVRRVAMPVTVVFGFGASTSAATVAATTATPSPLFDPLRFGASNLFLRHPAETILAAIGLGRLISSPRRTWPELLSACWLAGGILIIAFLHYAPLRYRLFFMPPAIAIAASTAITLMTGQPRAESGGRVRIADAIALVVILGVSLSSPSWPAFSLSVRLGGILAGMLILLPLMPPITRRLPIRAAAIILIVIGAIVHGLQWRQGEGRVSFHLRGLAHHLRQSRPDATLNGYWAAPIALRSGHQAYLETTDPNPTNGDLLLDDPDFGLSRSGKPIERWQLPPIKKEIVLYPHEPAGE